MKPRDIVLCRDERFGRHRFWEIQSVCIGGDKQEDLVELKSLTESPGCDTEGQRHATTLVPEPLLRGMTIYTPDIARAA